MVQRVIGVWMIVVGLVGVVAVIVLVAMRLDARGAAQRGPWWKRRLIAAGLATLAALGAVPRNATAADGPTEVAAGQADAETGEDATEAVKAIFALKAALERLDTTLQQTDFQREALQGAMAQCRAQLAVLSDADKTATLTDEGRAEAKRLVAGATDKLATAEALLPIGTNDLLKAPQWATITAAWEYCQPLADSGKSTNAERKKVNEHIAAAKKAAKALAAAGLLTGAEAGLLSAELDRIKTAVYRNPPTDTPVMCYDSGYLPPARRSTQRLAKRLPLLKAVAEAERVNPEALAKVLATVEKDLATLADEQQVEALGEGKSKAAELREAVAPLVEQIKAKVARTRLERTEAWGKVEAFREACKAHEAERPDLAGRFAEARKALDELLEAGLIDEARHAELQAEIQKAVLQRTIERDTPMCYKPMFRGDSRVTPEQRREILDRLERDGRVEPALARRIAADLEGGAERAL
ncbi:MAG: hypothetical protein KGY99_10895 [Phycisphaerae bacterium]|nr:hypothetical protein [Phycisphaerae bacterium]